MQSLCSYYVHGPDSQVTIDYNMFANDLIKHGYGNVKDFYEEVIKILEIFCDDDDQIIIKKSDLEAIVFSILEEFIPVFREGVPVCKESICDKED